VTRDRERGFKSNKNEDLLSMETQQKQAEKEKDELHAIFLVLTMMVAYILWTSYDIYFQTKPDTLDFLHQNGRLATVCFIYLVFIFGYLPEHYKYWVSVYKNLKLHHQLMTKEKAELIHLVLGAFCIVVFFGFVDFSFLGTKEGIPEIGSVAALSIIGMLGNIYRLRKTNRNERKRKRDKEKHIEEIRSRRNPPPKK
jgi:hypothetical protein